MPLRLLLRNLFSHPVRSSLTVASLVIAVFLLCFLRSLVVSLNAGVEASASNRIVVQSAVSLFVNLPVSYQGKIQAVEGVNDVIKWQWFGGVYQDPSNFFGQFAVDADRLTRTYPEIQLIEGEEQQFLQNRTACLVGEALARRFGWKVGDSVPLIGTIFPRIDGRAWDFQVAGIYRSTSANVDNQTMFFHFDYLEETRSSGGAGGPPGAGVFIVSIQPGSDPTRIMAEIDGQFENGPQRVQATTEAEFQRQFVSMIGSIPTFVSWIGGGVLFAIVLATLNTMLLAGRERIHDVGIMKALGFQDRTAFLMFLTEALLLCLFGGVLAVLLAKGSEPVIGAIFGTMLPGFEVTPETMALGLIGSALIGIVAGILPAWNASRLRCVEALRAEG